MADLSELARTVVEILDDPTILDLASRIREHELGCRACGETFPRTSPVASGKLVCSHCGADLRAVGYLDGRDVAALVRHEAVA